ncbi:phage tail sheath family protein [Streptomyces sp. NPDC003362]
MPVNVTYPGVYIDEVKSSVRTITGVPTSVAAFVGYAPRGPADRPVHITGWADYEAAFGGLQANCPMSYAVYQFYLNGGSEAEIVRVVQADEKPVRLPLGPSTSPKETPARPAAAPPKGNDAGDAAAEGEGGDAAADDKRKGGKGAGETAATERSGNRPRSTAPGLVAASPGRWGRSLRARVDYDTSEGPDLPKARRELFNLTVRDTETGAVERYLNVSPRSDHPRNLADLLKTSRLVRVDPDAPLDAIPEANGLPEKAGVDPFSLEPNQVARGDTRPLYYAPEQETARKPEDDERTSLGLTDYLGSPEKKTGLHQLLKTDIFNILCLPDMHWLAQHLAVKGGDATSLRTAALELCVDRRAILLVDPPPAWDPAQPASSADAVSFVVEKIDTVEVGDSGKNAAVYYPRILAPDPLRQGALRAFPPSGVMAGVLARTDVQRGVWKAPAGTDASLNGVSELEVPLTDLEIGRLNPLGVNCLRRLPAAGPVAWGARTLRGADRLADEWKYLPVRRLALFIEESLFRGTHWVVFEPNDEPLWASIRLNVGAFMNSLFRAGAFQGRTPQEAYLVKCDKDTNPQNDIDRGIVNIQVGFAPLKPAEFVIVHIQQLAGQIQV